MRIRLFTGVMVAAVAWTLTSAVAVSATPPFYAAPAKLGSLAPGTVIRSRTVSTRFGLEGVASSTSYQVLYRSTSATGKPIVTVATLLVPSHPASGVRRLVVVNPAYDALSLPCAPSDQLLPVADAGDGDVAPILMLEQGWDVLVPDYEGEQSEFGVGPLEGRTDLDAIRAFEHLGAGALNPQTRVGIEGMSGGAIPTMWADILLRSYARHIHLVGIAAADLPADILTLMPTIDKNFFYGAFMGLMVGFDRAYPAIDLGSLLNAHGKVYAAQVADDGLGCGNLPESSLVDKTSAYFKAPISTSADVAALPQVRKAFGHSNVDVAPVFSAPAFFYQEVHDELTYIFQADAAVKAQCAKGARIEYIRDEIGEHLLAIKSIFQQIDYLAARFDGKPVPDNCPTGNTQL